MTNIAESGFSGSLAHGVLTQSAPQDELVRSIIETLRTGGFTGVNVDFEYLYSFDRDSYSACFDAREVVVNYLRMTYHLQAICNSLRDNASPDDYEIYFYDSY